MLKRLRNPNHCCFSGHRLSILLRIRSAMVMALAMAASTAGDISVERAATMSTHCAPRLVTHVWAIDCRFENLHNWPV
jgi:hypothetical protein